MVGNVDVLKAEKNEWQAEVVNKKGSQRTRRANILAALTREDEEAGPDMADISRRFRCTRRARS